MATALLRTALALLASSAALALSPSATVRPWETVHAPPRAAAALMQVTKTAVTAGVSAATAVIGEVSKSVAKGGVEAPEAKSSFVSMDPERAGLVDENGLPLIYDKEAIQKYWQGQGSALQQRWRRSGRNSRAHPSLPLRPRLPPAKLLTRCFLPPLSLQMARVPG